MFSYHATADLLANRVILVTGAGDGIGRAAAQAFASHGATVILLGKTVPKLEETYDQLTAAGNATPAIIPLDLQGASEEHYRDLAATIESEFGRLDGILHNAGLLGQLAPIEHFDVPTWVVISAATAIALDVPLVTQDDGEQRKLTLCYPDDAEPSAGFISVLSPVGLALLGRRVGAQVSWTMPSGKQRLLTIDAMLFQPEASGDHTT